MNKPIWALLLLFLLTTANLTAANPNFAVADDDYEAKDFEHTRGSRISWARLKFPVTGYRQGDSLGWFYHPSGDIIVVDWLRRHTTINMMLQWNIADADKLEQMTDFPLLFLSGKGAMDLTPGQKANLREYLLRGGFLFVDDCVAKGQIKLDYFFDSVKATLREILPGIKLQKLALDHPIFKVYYKLHKWVHIQGVDNGLWGAWYEGKLVAMLDSSDLHCAWTKFWFTQAEQDFALKMAANIYIYSMLE